MPRDGNPAEVSWSPQPAVRWAAPLLRHGLVLTLATGILNGANWLYHVLMSRALGPIGYGALSALLGLLLVLAVPVNTIQMGVSAWVVRARADGQGEALDGLLASSLRGFLLFGVACFAIVAVLSGRLASLLKVESRVPIILMGTVLIWWSVLPVLRGLLQGAQRADPLGLSLASEGLVKLVAAVLLVMTGFGLAGAIGGVSLGAAAAVAVTLWSFRGWAQAHGRNAELQPMLRSLIPYAVAIGCFTVLTQADVVLVKTLFPPYEAGIYAAASTGGKIILYATGALPMVLLPEMARRHARREDGNRVLMGGLILGGVVGTGIVGVYLLAPGTVIRLLFGGPYADASPLLAVLGTAMLFYQAALTGIYYQLGRGSLGFLRRLPALTVIFPILVWLARENTIQVALVMVVLGAAAVAAAFWPSVS